MKRVTSISLALLVISVPWGTAHAQTATDVSGSLRIGQKLRIDVADVGILQGRFAGSNETSITLVASHARSEIPLINVERLWVRHRATRTGALIGAGTGALAGIIYGLLISQVACEPIDGGDCTTAQVVVVTGLLGSAGGAVVGAGVGYTVPIWSLRFP